MGTIGKSFIRLALLASVALPSYAFAQSTDQNRQLNPNDPTVSEPKPESQLPPVQSSDEPRPPPASPMAAPNAMVVSQAGVGGPVAYGRTGVLELGGSMSFSTASDFTEFSLRPSLGWFLANNFEISGILGLTYANVAGVSGTDWSLLAEPSYHLPFNSMLFGFLGVGAGLSHISNAGTGLALAPRLGLNIMIGRSGILTPALFAQYTTTDSVETPQGRLVAVTSSYGLQIGYTVMW